MAWETFVHLSDSERDPHLRLREGDTIQNVSGNGPTLTVTTVEPHFVIATGDGGDIRTRVINIANWRRRTA